MQVSIVHTTALDGIVFRLDAEFYHPEHLALQAKLDKINSISISDSGAYLDCSAFYPSIVPHYNFEKKGVPFLRINEIQDGLLHISKDTAFLAKEILDENNTTIACCFPGDLIIAKGGNSLAKVALLTEEYNYYSVCRDIIVLKTDRLSTINRFYLWMYLHSKIGQKVLLRTASQTGQPHLTLEAISQINIPVFSDIFQNSFEKFYDDSQKIEYKSKSKWDEAETILFSELGLTNWQPKHQLTFIKNYSDTQQAGRIDAEYFQPKYDEIIKAIKSYSGGWDNLGNLCETKRGSLISNSYYDYSTGIPYIRGADFSGGILNKEKMVLINKKFSRKNETKTNDGDIVFSLIGSVGETALVTKEFANSFISNNTGVIRCGGKVNSIVLQVLLRSTIGKMYFEKYKMQTAQPKISDKDTHNFVLPILSNKKQLEIQQKVTESFNLRKQSRHLLEAAKKAVEMAIEQDEKTAITWLQKEMQNLGAADTDG